MSVSVRWWKKSFCHASTHTAGPAQPALAAAHSTLCTVYSLEAVRHCCTKGNCTTHSHLTLAGYELVPRTTLSAAFFLPGCCCCVDCAVHRVQSCCDVRSLKLSCGPPRSGTRDALSEGARRCAPPRVRHRLPPITPLSLPIRGGGNPFRAHSRAPPPTPRHPSSVGPAGKDTFTSIEGQPPAPMSVPAARPRAPSAGPGATSGAWVCGAS
jgi:hypothetical protein|eukprot:COSAG01_NODE_3290_length_6307_cov_2.975519_3_plen_211_part_00